MCRTASDRCRSSLRSGMTTDTGGHSGPGDGGPAEAGDVCTMTSSTLLHAAALLPHGSPIASWWRPGIRGVLRCYRLRTDVLQARVLQHLGDQRGDLGPLGAGQGHVREQRVALELLDHRDHTVVPADP